MEANKVLDSTVIQNEGLTAYLPKYMYFKKVGYGVRKFDATA
jgi:hypothetical protein